MSWLSHHANQVGAVVANPLTAGPAAGLIPANRVAGGGGATPGAADQAKQAISNSNDIGEVLKYFRSGPGSAESRQYGDLALDVSNHAKERLAQLTGLDPNILSSMHDQEIIQSYQGNLEKKKIEDLATNQQGEINKFADDFSGKAKSFREQLAQSLQENNQKAFELQNPYIMEDLNKRGLFRSPTAVAGAQTDAQKELQLQANNSLLGFDTNAFGQEQDIRSGGLSNLLGGQEEGLHTAMDARRSGLEMSMNQIFADNQNALADSLARRKAKTDLTNSLISAGGQIVGGALSKK